MNILLPVFYVSTTLIIVFTATSYLLKIDLWPTPDKPLRTSLFLILGNLWIIANLYLAFILSIQQPSYLIFQSIIWKLLATLMISLSIILSLWAWKVFGLKRILGFKINKIITDGPYRYMRHPQYFAIALATLGLAILINTSYMLVFSISTIITFYLIALFEERKLSSIFGEEYMRYRRKTSLISLFIRKRKRT